MDNVKLYVADSESRTQFDLGQTCTSIEVTWSIFDQPGKISFTNIDGSEFFYEGSNVVMEVDDAKFFDGYLFKRRRNQTKTTDVTGYDRIRYLQNKDTKVFDNNSLTEIFTIVCGEQQLPFVVTNGSDYKTAPVVHDNKSLYAMIKRALDETFISTNAYIIVRDNGGALELIDITNPKMITDLVLGDKSLVTGYQFEASIDDNTYNYVKLIQENKATSKRDVYITLDSANINKWGQLQYFEKVEEEMNEAQIKARADSLLNLYNRKTKSLSITAIGDPRIREGVGIGIAISDLENEEVPFMQYAFVTKATHRFTRDTHMMDLDIEVV